MVGQKQIIYEEKLFTMFDNRTADIVCSTDDFCLGARDISRNPKHRGRASGGLRAERTQLFCGQLYCRPLGCKDFVGVAGKDAKDGQCIAQYRRRHLRI